MYSATTISETMIRTAFYLSKMTVIDEVRDGAFEFTHLHFVEFLEFIGRLSWSFFEQTLHHFEWNLAQKIEVILSWLFKPIRLAVTRPRDRDGFVSDSDDDY